MNSFWLNNSNSEKDNILRHFLVPQRIVFSDYGKGIIDKTDALLRDDKANCVITCNSEEPPAVVLDFGQELNGGVVIELANSDPAFMAKIRIRFGESVSEVMNTPNNDHCIHDITLEMSAMGRHEFGNTGFRFVRLDFIDCDINVNLQSVKALALERDLEYKGSFESSDTLLNDIWKIGARTVHLCCQDYIFDGIKRDRIVWMGDIHPQVHIIASVFGDIDIVPKSLEYIFKTTDKDQWMNEVSSYSIWWIITLWEWYYYTGDKKWLNSQKHPVEVVVDRLISHIDDSGRERLGGMRFIDWIIGFKDGIVSEGLQALTVYGLNSAKMIFDKLGDEEQSENCTQALKLLKKAKLERLRNKQVNSLRVLAGLIDAEFANKESLSVDPLKDISTWYGYYVLQARAAAGDFDGCMDFIRKIWGGMLALGATTFWEHFDVDWLDNGLRIDELPVEGKNDVHANCGDHCYKGHRHSLCHGWAGGATPWLSKYVLGIQPAAPGCKKIRIKPHLNELEFAKGSFPTNLGIINVEHKKDSSGKIETKIEKPKQIEIID